MESIWIYPKCIRPFHKVTFSFQTLFLLCVCHNTRDLLNMHMYTRTPSTHIHVQYVLYVDTMNMYAPISIVTVLRDFLISHRAEVVVPAVVDEGCMRLSQPFLQTRKSLQRLQPKRLPFPHRLVEVVRLPRHVSVTTQLLEPSALVQSFIYYIMVHRLYRVETSLLATCIHMYMYLLGTYIFLQRDIPPATYFMF